MSKKIRLCFYRPRRDGHLLDDAIATHTGFWNFLKEIWVCKGNVVKAWKIISALRSSHVEIWTPDQFVLFRELYLNVGTEHSSESGTEYRLHGKCYTSTMRGDNAGTCVRPASEIFKNPSRWFYCEIELTDEAYKWLVEDMELKVANNTGYDKKLLWKFFMPRFMAKWLKVDDPNKDICSEFCGEELFNCVRGHIYGWVSVLFIKDADKIARFVGSYKPNPSPVTLAKYCYKAGFKFYEMDGREVKP